MRLYEIGGSTFDCFVVSICVRNAIDEKRCLARVELYQQSVFSDIQLMQFRHLVDEESCLRIQLEFVSFFNRAIEPYLYVNANTYIYPKCICQIYR